MKKGKHLNKLIYKLTGNRRLPSYRQILRYTSLNIILSHEKGQTFKQVDLQTNRKQKASFLSTNFTVYVSWVWLNTETRVIMEAFNNNQW